MFNETVRAISTDVLGFKSIRNRLFNQASAEKSTESGKLYLYLFHLFESLVANISVLVQKSSSHMFAQCPPDVVNKKAAPPKKD